MSVSVVPRLYRQNPVYAYGYVILGLIVAVVFFVALAINSALSLRLQHNDITVNVTVTKVWTETRGQYIDVRFSDGQKARIDEVPDDVSVGDNLEVLQDSNGDIALADGNIFVESLILFLLSCVLMVVVLHDARVLFLIIRRESGERQGR